MPIGVTAILPDGLNTAWGDQAIARKHVIRYLQTIQPDDRIALYALGRELRVLRESLERKPGATSLRVLIRDFGSGKTGRVIVPFPKAPQ